MLVSSRLHEAFPHHIERTTAVGGLVARRAAEPVLAVGGVAGAAGDAGRNATRVLLEIQRLHAAAAGRTGGHGRGRAALVDGPVYEALVRPRPLARHERHAQRDAWREPAAPPHVP